MAKWEYTIKNGLKLREAIDSYNLEGVRDQLIECYAELAEKMGETSLAEFIDEKIDNLRMMTTVNEDIDFELAEFYEFCDTIRAWVAI